MFKIFGEPIITSTIKPYSERNPKVEIPLTLFGIFLKTVFWIVLFYLLFKLPAKELLLALCIWTFLYSIIFVSLAAVFFFILIFTISFITYLGDKIDETLFVFLFFVILIVILMIMMKLISKLHDWTIIKTTPFRIVIILIYLIIKLSSNKPQWRKKRGLFPLSFIYIYSYAPSWVDCGANPTQLFLLAKEHQSQHKNPHFPPLLCQRLFSHPQEYQSHKYKLVLLVYYVYFAPKKPKWG